MIKRKVIKIRKPGRSHAFNFKFIAITSQEGFFKLYIFQNLNFLLVFFAFFHPKMKVHLSSQSFLPLYFKLWFKIIFPISQFLQSQANCGIVCYHLFVLLTSIWDKEAALKALVQLQWHQGLHHPEVGIEGSIDRPEEKTTIDTFLQYYWRQRANYALDIKHKLCTLDFVHMDLAKNTGCPYWMIILRVCFKEVGKREAEEK